MYTIGKTAKSLVLFFFSYYFLTGVAAQVGFEEIIPASGSFFDGEFRHINGFDFADVDGDEDLDILITGGIKNGRFKYYSKLYLNNGEGYFYLDSVNNFDGDINGSVAFVDVDADDDFDAVITGPDQTLLYWNDGIGNFTKDTNNVLISLGHGAIASADVDGDDDLDLLLAGWDGGNATELYKNDGFGHFNQDTTANLEGMERGALAFSDFDGDKDVDLLITGFDNNQNRSSKLYFNDGFGKYVLDGSAPFKQLYYSWVAVADVDGDEDQDVLLSGDVGGKRATNLYLNGGNGDFTLDSTKIFPGVDKGASVFADIDGDDDLDLLLTGENDDFENISQLYLNDGNGNFSLLTTVEFDVFDFCRIAFVDIDGDSDLDVFMTGAYVATGTPPLAKFYRNTTPTDIEIKQEVGFSVYPNPSSGTYFLEVEEPDNQDLKISIFDAEGNYFDLDLKGLNQDKIEIDLSDKPFAVYFICVHNITTGDQKIIKLLKQ